MQEAVVTVLAFFNKPLAKIQAGRDITEGICRKASASQEEAKAEHRGSASGHPGTSAGIADACAYSGQLWNRGKQYLPRIQAGGGHADPGQGIFTARAKGAAEK